MRFSTEFLNKPRELLGNAGNLIKAPGVARLLSSERGEGEVAMFGLFLGSATALLGGLLIANGLNPRFLHEEAIASADPSMVAGGIVSVVMGVGISVGCALLDR